MLSLLALDALANVASNAPAPPCWEADLAALPTPRYERPAEVKDYREFELSGSNYHAYFGNVALFEVKVGDEPLEAPSFDDWKDRRRLDSIEGGTVESTTVADGTNKSPSGQALSLIHI